MEHDRYAPLREALGREYRIEEVLQETASGAVYLAHDLTLNRRVIVKALDPALAGEARATEFGWETRVLAGLSHPSIPSVHHAGTSGEFRFVVLEHPGSETLSVRVSKGPLTPDEIIRLGVQLLSALEVVHAAGIVHTEVNAENIVVADGRYVLAGFAAAKPASSGGAPLGDLRAVGLLLKQAVGAAEGSRRRLTRKLQPVLGRALSLDSTERWQSAADFRTALESVDNRPAPRRGAKQAAAGIALAAAATYGAHELLQQPGPPGPPARELAILPLEVDGGQPLDPLGSNLARLIQLNLDNVPRLGLTSRRQVDQWWESQGRDALGMDASTAARALRAHWVAHGLVERRPGDTLRVQLVLHDSLGTDSILPQVRGSAQDLAALGDSVTRQIIRVVVPRRDSLYEAMPGFARVPFAALRAFLQGEAAFSQDAWALAQRYYEIALGADPSFALAEWRLANVRHWRRLPDELDLRSVYRRQGARLRPADRMMMQALLEPDLRLRFAKLDTAITRQSADGYARLLQGEELFHRGPLVGLGLDLSVPVMAAAVARDSLLALAHDHLVLAHIRFGRREEARRALGLRRRVAGGVRPDDLDLVPFLELVYDERFVPWRAWLRYRVISWRQDPRQLHGIEELARSGTPWLDMPQTQLRYCDLLLRAGRPTTETHATAHEGKGLALFAMGRPSQALAEIDSAAALLDSPEARLQQAEWWVIPPALGLPKAGSGEWERDLEELAGDSVLGGRAAWALALADYAAGDTIQARHWTDRVPAGSPLRTLLEAREAAARGDLDRALAGSDSARVAFQATDPPDAFAVAAFHLLRGDWLAASGERARADAEWIWYEATDSRGWPQGLAQAGEVDAALGVFARLKQARALLAGGAPASDSLRACSYLQRVRVHWSDAETSMRTLVQEAAALARSCPQ